MVYSRTRDSKTVSGKETTLRKHEEDGGIDRCKRRFSLSKHVPPARETADTYGD